MTDIQMTILCAQAMGYGFTEVHFPTVVLTKERAGETYAPIYDDEQAMALVKKFLGTKIENIHHSSRATGGPPHKDIPYWRVFISTGVCYGPHHQWVAENKDLNRAVVECVAKMQVDRARETVTK